jgi:hypothetical protein
MFHNHKHFHHKKSQPEKNPKVVTQRVMTGNETIHILDVKETVSIGQIRKTYDNGMIEYGTFDKKGNLLVGMRVHPEYDGYWTTQKYEKGQFKNGVLCIGKEYELERRYGDTVEISYDVLGHLKMHFKYDSDYREEMLKTLWLDDQVVLEARTTYMCTKNHVDEELIQKLHKYLPGLKNESCASFRALNDNYLRKSSKFVRTLLDLASKKEMGHKRPDAPIKKESTRSYRP